MTRARENLYYYYLVDQLENNWMELAVGRGPLYGWGLKLKDSINEWCTVGEKMVLDKTSQALSKIFKVQI